METPKDEDLLGEVGPAPNVTTDLPDVSSEPTGSLAQAIAAPTPALPDLPDEAAAPLPAREVAPAPSPAAPFTPDLPDLPEDEPAPQAEVDGGVAQPAEEVAPATEAEQDNRIWPWPKAEPWTPTQVYQEVVTAMDHVKNGDMHAAATTLDTLGPHLEENLDMLLHVSVLMQHLGRHDHMKWTLDMAAYVYPHDAHVQQARARLLI